MNSNHLKNSKYFEYVSCPLCGNEKLSLFFSIPYGKLKQKKSLDYSPLGIDKNTILSVSKCRKCKFVFTNPRIRKEYEEMVYNECKQNQYKDKKSFVIGTPENNKFNRENKLKYLPVLLKTLPLLKTDNSLKLFDFGCGFGHVLSFARELGIEGIGIEIDNFLLNYCKLLGLTVFSPNEFKDQYPESKFDIVVCQSVIEHVNDLTSFLSYVDSISKEDTVLYINGVTPKLIKIENRRKRFVKAHFLEHVNYFYNTTLDYFMNKIDYYPFKKRVVYIIHDALIDCA